MAGYFRRAVLALRGPARSAIAAPAGRAPGRRGLDFVRTGGLRARWTDRAAGWIPRVGVLSESRIARWRPRVGVPGESKIARWRPRVGVPGESKIARWRPRVGVPGESKIACWMPRVGVPGESKIACWRPRVGVPGESKIACWMPRVGVPDGPTVTPRRRPSQGAPRRAPCTPGAGGVAPSTPETTPAGCPRSGDSVARHAEGESHGLPDACLPGGAVPLGVGGPPCRRLQYGP